MGAQYKGREDAQQLTGGGVYLGPPRRPVWETNHWHRVQDAAHVWAHERDLQASHVESIVGGPTWMSKNT